MAKDAVGEAGFIIPMNANAAISNGGLPAVRQQHVAELPPGRIVVPCEFLDQAPVQQLFVDEQEAQRLCGLANRSPSARRQAFWQLRRDLGFTVFKGRLFNPDEMKRKRDAAALKTAAVKNAKAMSH